LYSLFWLFWGLFYPLKIFDLQLYPLLQRVIVDFSVFSLCIIIGLLLLTLIFGRFYCSLLCPFGILSGQVFLSPVLSFALVFFSAFFCILPLIINFGMSFSGNNVKALFGVSNVVNLALGLVFSKICNKNQA